MLYAEFFIEGEKVCQLNGELQVDICSKESYILLYDFDQGFTITPWANGCFFEAGTSLIRNTSSRQTQQMPSNVKKRSFGFMRASQSIHQFPVEVMPLQKSSGGLNWCPSIHYRENLDFTPAGIRVAFSYCRTQIWKRQWVKRALRLI